MLAIYNKKFKNNKKFERYNYLAYMAEESTFLEVDCTSEVNSLFLSDSTNNGAKTPDRSEPELNVPAIGDVANESSVCDNDSNQGDMDLEDDPSDTHEDDDYEVSYMIPVPKNGTPKDSSLTPISIMVVDTIGLLPSRKLLKSRIHTYLNSFGVKAVHI